MRCLDDTNVLSDRVAVTLYRELSLVCKHAILLICDEDAPIRKVSVCVCVWFSVDPASFGTTLLTLMRPSRDGDGDRITLPASENVDKGKKK